MKLGACVADAVFHGVLLLLLALMVVAPQKDDRFDPDLVATIAEEREQPEVPLQFADVGPLSEVEEATAAADVATEVIPPLPIQTDTELVPDDSALPEAGIADVYDRDLDEPLASDVAGSRFVGAGPLAGRSKAGRSALVAREGGNAASEAAVEAGLRWLSQHQRPDGSWSFDHVVRSPMPFLICQRDCTDPGSLKNCPNGATAMALLSFLGAGYTHVDGDYRRQVRAGLMFLLLNRKIGAHYGDLRGGSEHEGMYVQGLATIALSEALILTRDRALYRPTQSAVNFIVEAQDPVGGGWRYKPREKGDTSVIGWQVMALKSAQFADLFVPRSTLYGADYFLTSVQSDEGARYGYTSPSSKPSTTAIGLLSRMYLGWPREHQPLYRGVRYLDETGPSQSDMYYNYYATQVMHHWGGDLWERWNSRMRDQLLATQSTSGHAAGSWMPRGGHSAEGGRLYTTCLSIMTLEVYYRHMPLYQRRNLADGEQ